MPCKKDEEKEGREPFAVLKYGNVVIELDYTIMRYLTIDNESHVFTKAAGTAIAAFQEIIKEMDAVLYDHIPFHHRDSDSEYLNSMTHNPLHPTNKEEVVWCKDSKEEIQ
jgi:chromosomal replication initiation ATPase DnaA